MELSKDKWTKHDIKDYLLYLSSFSKGEKSIEFEQKIVRTNRPCIAVSCKDINNIVRQIGKGNYLSYLDLKILDNHACTIIYAQLLGKIKDFDVFERYLDDYVTTIDNWASCDQIKFPVTKENADKFLALSKKYISSKLPFVRRVGILILFKLINDQYIDDILKICDKFFDESFYYVNMAISWLLCECMVKEHDKTMQYFTHKNRLNAFVINKTISKCQDSFRISNEDKLLLKNYRKK